MFTKSKLILSPQVAVVCLLLFASIALISAEKPGFSLLDKAHYADANLVAFVRPGLEIAILTADIGPDGTITARVRFTDPKGLPLDKDGVFTPGTISASLIAATIPQGQEQYVAYTTRVKTTPEGVSATQAAADSGGVWEKVGDGEYVYTFGTRAPSDIDRSATHTIGIYASRDLSEFDLGVNLRSVEFNFVPDGSPVTKVRDVIRTASCNRCHNRLTAHGNTGREGVAMCILCHSPQTKDPFTGNTVDFKVMIHKIHRGESLPSVKAGTRYTIVGFRQRVSDFSGVAFPPSGEDTTRQCEVCHQTDTGATQADEWLTDPTRAACGSCHDDVNFATGENHAGGLPQVSDNLCANCHIPEGELEFDASIIGAHTTPRFSKELPGVVFGIESVEDGSPGKNAVVTFTIHDKKGDPLVPSEFSALNLDIAGPTSDISGDLDQAVTDNFTGSNGTYTVKFDDPIPADARGTWVVGIEGRRPVKLLAGTVQARTVNDAGKNVTFDFSVDGSEPQPRRRIVALEKCNACHVSLSLHGDLRNQTTYCVQCHNPTATDEEERPEDQLPAEAIDFRTMIHRIHTGKDLGREFVIFGFRGSVNDFSDIEFPGFRNDCATCHVDNSQQLPLKADLLQVNDPRGFLNPVGPTAAACLGCHSDIQAASHALANTTVLGESCAACHGPDKEFSVDRVHAQ